MTSLKELVQQTTARFSAVGIESPEANAEILAAHFLGISRGELAAQIFLNQPVTNVAEFEQLVLRRLSREPLQHITGVAHFRHLDLKVGPGVFIPRPETESVVQIALDYLAPLTKPRVLDIGTGSGAIAISIATESDAQVTAIEKSESAANFARENISTNSAEVELKVGDFRELALGFEIFELVISNPPYIPDSAIPLDPEVRDFDPELALYGGTDGLDLVREIIELAELLLVSGGKLVLEHADGQSDAVCELLLANWKEVRAHSDSTGRLRSVSATK